jgi:hypothetical protein
LEIHTKRYGCFNFSRWIIPKIQKFVHLSYFCCPIPSLPKLGSSSSQKPAQQHFSSPQAAAHVIFKGWTAEPSLSPRLDNTWTATCNFSKHTPRLDSTWTAPSALGQHAWQHLQGTAAGQQPAASSTLGQHAWQHLQGTATCSIFCTWTPRLAAAARQHYSQARPAAAQRPRQQPILSSSPFLAAHVKSHPSCAGSNVLEYKNTNTSLVLVYK